MKYSSVFRILIISLVIGILGDSLIVFLGMRMHSGLQAEQERLNDALAEWNRYNSRTGQLLISSENYTDLLQEWLRSIESFESALADLSASHVLRNADSSISQSLENLGLLWELSGYRIATIRESLSDLGIVLGEDLSLAGGVLFNLGQVVEKEGPYIWNKVFVLRTNVRELLAMNDEYYTLLYGIVHQLRSVISRMSITAFLVMAVLSILIIMVTFFLLSRILSELEQTNRALESHIRETFLTQEQLRRAKDDAESADRAKTQFLANVSHELRTPLNSIIGYAELNLMPSERRQEKEYSSHIIRESEKLLYLVNDLLDFSRLEFHKLKLEAIDFSMSDLLNDSTETIKLRAERKGLDFSLITARDMPERLKGDPFRLRQVLVNLLDNAVKFTERGGVTLRVAHESTVEHSCMIRFQVEDTGVGIPPELQEKIFESFIQVDGSMGRKYGGAGLGTAIVKHLVTLMGGQIELESTPGRGSRFSFTIPFAYSSEDSHASSEKASLPEEEKTEPVHAGVSGTGRRILLVDDYPPNVEVAVQFLEQGGYEVELAQNGVQAVEKTRSAHYDLILMDIQMPEMDGYQTSMLIRESDGSNRNIPILALSANAFPSDYEKALAAGMNGLLAKPVRRSALLAAVAKWSSDQRPSVENPCCRNLPESGFRESGEIVIHLQDFQEEMGGAETAETLILGFLHAVREQLPRMRAALQAGDLLSLHREAHSIKGGAMNIMAPGLEHAARCLELSAKETDPAGAREGLSQLESEFRKLTDYLDPVIS